MKKIRVLQILEATIGGTRTHLKLLVSHLDKQKFDVSVICATRRSPAFLDDIELMRRMGITVYIVDMVREINPIKDFHAFLQILSIIRKNKFDIVHTHSSKAGVLGRFAAFIAGVPRIYYSPHAFSFLGCRNRIYRFIYLMIEKVLAFMTTKIICVSESEKFIARSYKIIKESKIIAIQNAIDLEKCTIDLVVTSEIEDRFHLSQKIVIGSVAYFRTQKNYTLLIKSAPRVIKSDKRVVFLIIGDGEQFSIMQKRIKDLDLQENFILTGHVDDICPYYHIMDIFILTSLWEGMPYSILEAMAFGLPVIATDVVGTRDLVIHQHTGFLVSSQDADAFANVILQLVENQNLRARLARNGKKLINEQFLMKNRILELETLYEQNN